MVAEEEVEDIEFDVGSGAFGDCITVRLGFNTRRFAIGLMFVFEDNLVMRLGDAASNSCCLGATFRGFKIDDSLFAS